MFRKLFRYSKGYRLQTILSPICVTIEAIVEVLIPLLMSEIINNGLGTGTTPANLNIIWECGLLMVILAFVSLLFGILSGVFATKASAGVAKNLRKDMFQSIETYSFSNIDSFSTSSLVTRMTTDVNNVQMAFQMMIRILFRAPILFITALVLTFIKNWQIALIFLAFCPFLLGVIIVIMMRAHPYFKVMFKKYDRLNLVVQENVNAIRTVKAFVTEEEEKEKFYMSSNDVMTYSKKAEKIIILQQPLCQLIMGAANIIIILVGAHMVVENILGTKYGDITLFIMYAQQILSSLIMVSMVLLNIVMSRAALERIFEVIETKSDLVNPENPVYDVADGSIDFKHVFFSYSKENKKPVLKDINIQIHSGETIGIFGGTGSGKSSLISLISRLYDASEGEVFVGGRNVKEYDLFTLRDQVSVVLQKNVLFSGTVRSNLLWGNENATEEEMMEVLKLASADEFILTKEEGLDAIVEQGGVNFSGGQKQRLCIARALLKKPKILILDDSTSAVDTATDAKIRAAFKSYIPSTTKIIIAQRISSIMDADKILFLDKGEVISFGTHEELMKENEIYREITNSQMKGIADESDSVKKGEN